MPDAEAVFLPAGVPGARAEGPGATGDRLGRAEAAVSGAALAALVLLPLLDMASRRVLGRALPGIAGWVQHLTLVLTFLGGLLATGRDRHLALATGAFIPAGGARRAAAIASAAATVIVSVALAAAATTFVLAERASTDVLAGGVPVWAIEAVMPAGFLLVALRAWWRVPGGLAARAAVLAAATAAALAVGAGIGDRALLGSGVALVAVAVALGAPLYVGIGGLALLLFRASGEPVAAVAAETYRLAASPALPTIPLFAVAGTVLALGGASRRLVGVFRALAGWLPGGTAVAAVAACAFLTALTGASGVTILAVGGFLLPVLRHEGYPEDGATALVTASGSIGLLFPPSLPVVLYAVYAEVSFRDVFVAGLVPGVLLVVAVTAWAIRLGVRARVPRTPFDGRAAVRAVAEARWDLLLPVVAGGALATGLATLVETAALTAGYALVLELGIHRTLSLRRDGARLVAETAVLFGSLLFVLGVALGLTSWLVDAEVPARAAAWVRGSIASPVVFLLLLNLFLLGVGMLMDVFSAIVVVVPLVVPMGRAFGIDPLHLGIVFLANLELGYLTPPVGLNLFLGSLRFGRPVLEMARLVLPYVVLLLAWVLVVTYVPALTLGLGRLLHG